jgi:hypothetical protein
MEILHSSLPTPQNNILTAQFIYQCPRIVRNTEYTDWWDILKPKDLIDWSAPTQIVGFDWILINRLALLIYTKVRSDSVESCWVIDLETLLCSFPHLSHSCLRASTGRGGWLGGRIVKSWHRLVINDHSSIIIIIMIQYIRIYVVTSPDSRLPITEILAGFQPVNLTTLCLYDIGDGKLLSCPLPR